MQKEYVSKQGRKPAKAGPTVHKDPTFDDLDNIVDDATDYMESEDAQDEGRTRSVMLEEKESVEIKDAEDSDRPRATSTRSVLTLKPLPKIDPKDKGKKVLREEAESDAESEGVDEAERKFDQLAKDEEIARKVQEDWEEEEKMKKLAEEEATKAAIIQDFDDIQARIEADRLLAARLQEEEKEMFTVEERAKFLYDTIVAQRRFLAQKRAVAIISRPPTRTQLRNQIMTYLKHIGGKKHADLKNKNFDEIQVLYKKVKRSDKDFIAIGSAEDERQIKEMNEESKDPKKKRVVNETPREEDTSKPDDDSDDEHRKCLRIVTFDSTIDSEIMETKSFIARLHKVSSPDGNYLVVYRVNGHFRAFNYLMEGGMKIMMESSTEENDQELKDGTVIYMLVERKYPLSKELLQQMLDLGLEVEEEKLSKGANSLQAEEQDIPPPTITAMKIPIIRKGEYDIWSMRMRQYICHTDHNLWDVIVNGDLEEEPAPTGETSAPPAPKTAKQLAARRNQERVKDVVAKKVMTDFYVFCSRVLYGFLLKSIAPLLSHIMKTSSRRMS
ncbi:hypothetical protein Tco_0962871 [Tanacetum coccineum]